MMRLVDSEEEEEKSVVCVYVCAHTHMYTKEKSYEVIMRSQHLPAGKRAPTRN